VKYNLCPGAWLTLGLAGSVLPALLPGEGWVRVRREGRAGTFRSGRFLQRDLFSAVGVAVKNRGV